MKKLLLRVGVIVVVAAVLLVLAGALLFGPAAGAAVERGAQAGLGVDASLGGVDAGLGVGESSLAIEDLVVENPEGIAAAAPFLRVGSFSAEVETFSVLSSTVRVPRIALDGLELRLVQDGARSNVAEVLRHVRAVVSGRPPAPEEEPAEEREPTLLWVGDVSVAGVAITAHLTGLGPLDVERTYEVPAFEIDVAARIQEYRRERGGATEVDGEPAGVTPAELAGVIALELVERGLAAAEGVLPPKALEVLRGGAEGLEGSAREALDDVLEEVESIRDAAEDQGREAGEVLKERAGKAIEDVLGGDG